EVVPCKECGEVYLDIEISGNKVIQPAKDENFDEFELEVENDPEAIIEDEGIEETVRTGNEALLVKSSLHRNGKVYINRDTREYSGREQKNSFEAHIKEYINDPNGLPCPNCQDSSKVKYKRFRGHTIGAPSLLNVLLPTLLQYGE